MIIPVPVPDLVSVAAMQKVLPTFEGNAAVTKSVAYFSGQWHSSPIFNAFYF